MGKIRIALDSDAAPTFKHKVDIPTPAGAAPVEFVFRYRDRLAMAALLDAWAERPQPELQSSESFEDGAKRGIKADVEALLDIAEGWDLPWQFGAEKLELFVTRYPGAALAVLGAYRAACVQGRLGN